MRSPSPAPKKPDLDGEHENLLEFGLVHDIPMVSGCRADTHCGSCTTAIHEGEVDVGNPNITADCSVGPKCTGKRG